MKNRILATLHRRPNIHCRAIHNVIADVRIDKLYGQLEKLVGLGIIKKSKNPMLIGDRYTHRYKLTAAKWHQQTLGI